MMAAFRAFANLLSLLLPLLCAVRRAETSYYYEIVPYVTFGSSSGNFERKFVGSYASYASANDAFGRLFRAPAEHLECGDRQQVTDTTTNDTLVSYSGSILLLELTDCSDYFQAALVDYRLDADGLIFYYLTDGGESGRRVSLGYRPEGSSVLDQFAVVLIGLTRDQLLELESVTANSSDVTAKIEPGQRQNIQTSHTFYFVVFAFSILMLLSCLWFVTSYVRRCRSSVRDRRRMQQNQRATHRIINKLELRTYKVAKGSKELEAPTCAVCLESFVNNDAIRILPCRHEFHKKCVDPWLKLKRTCPICKQGITPESPGSHGHSRALEPRERGRSSSESAPLSLGSQSQVAADDETAMEEGQFTENVFLTEGEEAGGAGEQNSAFAGDGDVGGVSREGERSQDVAIEMDAAPSFSTPPL